MEKTNKCPNCGSTLAFDPGTNSLTCDYCASKFKVDSIAITNDKKPYDTSLKLQETTVAQYHCNSCRSNLNIYKDTPVKRCPNCSSTDLAKTNNISYTPDAIVPFQITKEQATNNFYDWIRHRKFAPGNLKKLARLGKISGFYTPIWNFDCLTSTIYSGVGVDEDTDKDGHTHTSRYPFSGRLSSKYTDILISANKQVSNITISALGDWGLNNLKVYNLEYLCGFIGTDTDFDIHASYRDFTNYINNAEAKKARREKSAQYDRIDNFKSTTNIYQPKFNYIYLPIYANYYTYKDKKYTCYINGYSGKVSGNAPKSGWKIFSLILSILLIVAAVGIGIYLFVDGVGGNINPSIPSDFPTPRIVEPTGFPEIQNFSL